MYATPNYGLSILLLQPSSHTNGTFREKMQNSFLGSCCTLALIRLDWWDLRDQIRPVVNARVSSVGFVLHNIVVPVATAMIVSS